MDRYPQAKQVVSQKGVKAAGVPFLSQLQLGGVILSLALGYGSGSFWWGCGLMIAAISGLAVYRQELVVVRIWHYGVVWVRVQIGRPVIIEE